MYAHPNTSLFFSDKSEGKGTLYLTDRFALAFAVRVAHLAHCRNLIWLSDEKKDKGFSLTYATIASHAVRQTAAHVPCCSRRVCSCRGT